MNFFALSILYIVSLGPESGSPDPYFDDIHIHLNDIVDNDGNMDQVNRESEGKNQDGGYACMHVGRRVIPMAIDAAVGRGGGIY